MAWEFLPHFENGQRWKIRGGHPIINHMKCTYATSFTHAGLLAVLLRFFSRAPLMPSMSRDFLFPFSIFNFPLSSP
jgi:hypothetical protein